MLRGGGKDSQKENGRPSGSSRQMYVCAQSNLYTIAKSMNYAQLLNTLMGVREYLSWCLEHQEKCSCTPIRVLIPPPPPCLPLSLRSLYNSLLNYYIKTSGGDRVGVGVGWGWGGNTMRGAHAHP